MRSGVTGSEGCSRIQFPLTKTSINPFTPRQMFSTLTACWRSFESCTAIMAHSSLLISGIRARICSMMSPLPPVMLKLIPPRLTWMARALPARGDLLGLLAL